MNKLLYNADEARAFLGIGEKAFRALGVPAKRVGKRKKYRLCDLEAFVNNLPTEQACRSLKGKAHRSTNMTSPSEGIGFAEAVKQTMDQRRGRLKQSSVPTLSLVSTSNGSRV